MIYIKPKLSRLANLTERTGYKPLIDNDIISPVIAIIIATTLFLRSLSEISALPDTELAQSPEFELDGTVTDLDIHGDFAFSDKSGRAFIYHGSAQLPRQGDHIIVRGHATVDRSRYRLLCASTVTVTSHGDPPAPVDASLTEVTSGALDYQTARVKGRITDIHNDEISTNCLLLTMTDGREMAIFPAEADLNQSDYLNAEVAITGIIRPVYRGTRIFSTYLISQSKGTSIDILTHPPKDKFSAKELGDLHHITPQRIAHLGYRRVMGRVCATWNRNHILVNPVQPSRQPIHVILQKGATLPSCGDAIDVVGYVETDLFTVLLTDAEWKSATDPTSLPPLANEQALPTTIQAITRTDDSIGRKFSQLPIGNVVELKGTVRHVSGPETDNNTITLEEGGNTIEIDASMEPAILQILQPGSIIRIRGIYLLLAERWHPTPRFPNVYGALIIVRNAADIDIISQPPWWTPKMLVFTIFTLVLIAIGILIWNRILNRLVERRSRALIKERLAHDEAILKKEERTKLAVELHDSLSQNLTGIAFQLDVAELTAESNPNDVLPHLRQIRFKMQNCRDNLKNCLWDLRNLAIDQIFLADSLRETLAPIVGQTKITIDFPVRNSNLDDSIVHAIICIVRELTVNAIRHGKATQITISGRLNKGGIDLSVQDNGVGFDPVHRQGTPEGHFGLQGVTERVSRFNGEISIISHIGKGTKISIQGLHEET